MRLLGHGPIDNATLVGVGETLRCTGMAMPAQRTSTITRLPSSPPPAWPPPAPV